jgi:hypothetical protein
MAALEAGKLAAGLRSPELVGSRLPEFMKD